MELLHDITAGAVLTDASDISSLLVVTVSSYCSMQTGFTSVFGVGKSLLHRKNVMPGMVLRCRCY